MVQLLGVPVDRKVSFPHLGLQALKTESFSLKAWFDIDFNRFESSILKKERSDIHEAEFQTISR